MPGVICLRPLAISNNFELQLYTAAATHEMTHPCNPQKPARSPLANAQSTTQRGF
jgi:hypothetical protein